jgi:hypothetical protein
MKEFKERLGYHLVLSVFAFGGFWGYITQSLKVMLIMGALAVVAVEIMYLLDKIFFKIFKNF